MGIVLRGLVEEIVAIGSVVRARTGLGGEGRFDTFGMVHFECAIYLVGGYVVETLALIPFGQGLPIEFGGLEQGERTHHVGAGEREGVLDGAVHVALGCQVDDAVHVFVLHQLIEGIKVADVHLDETIVGTVLNIFEVGKVARVGQFVEVDNLVFGVLVDKQADNVATDKSGTASDDNGSFEFHSRKGFCWIRRRKGEEGM